RASKELSQDMENGHHDVMIIGSGPAGRAAALYSARANLSPLVIEGFDAGGQLMLTSDVENYPGFPDGVIGPYLMALFRNQAERFGATFVTDDATEVDFSERPFKVQVRKDAFTAEAVIVATGAKAKMLGLASEQRLLGRGVSTCATCDGAFFKNQGLLVVGGGDSALEEALFLQRFASKLSVIHRREQLRASKIMQDRAMASDKISFVWNSTVDEVLGGQKVEGARLRNLQTGELTDISAGGIFVANGHTGPGPTSTANRRDPQETRPKKEAHMGEITEITDHNFETDVLQSATPVLVDFWAEWCGPCRFVRPEVEAVALELGERLKV